MLNNRIFLSADIGADADFLVRMRILWCGCEFFGADADFSNGGAASNLDIIEIS
jgi:hypothetical protein